MTHYRIYQLNSRSRSTFTFPFSRRFWCGEYQFGWPFFSQGGEYKINRSKQSPEHEFGIRIPISYNIRRNFHSKQQKDVIVYFSRSHKALSIKFFTAVRFYWVFLRFSASLDNIEFPQRNVTTPIIIKYFTVVNIFSCSQNM